MLTCVGLVECVRELIPFHTVVSGQLQIMEQQFRRLFPKEQRYNGEWIYEYLTLLLLYYPWIGYLQQLMENIYSIAGQDGVGMQKNV